MTILHIALWAALEGPRVRREVSGQDVLAEHLDWARRSRLASRPREQEEPFEDAEPSEPLAAGAEAEDGAPLPLEAFDACDVLASAAVELDQAWEADVLASVPSQLLVGLSGTAARAAFLLGEVAPERATRFDRLGELFMSRGDGHRQVSDEELGRAVDELEALVSAVTERARDAYAGLSADGQETLRLRWKARAEDPRGDERHSCGGCGSLPGIAAAPRCTPKDGR